MLKHSIIHKISYSLILALASFCFSGYDLKAQSSYKVLFIGNSYTYVNNLPQMVHDAAVSAGDNLIFDSYAVGGYQLINHNLDANCQNKIMAGGWDYVVIQGQSQEPVMASNQFNNGGNALYAKIKQYNPCAVTMPYMTWGRKNGDAANCGNFPLMCTYQSMDSTLKQRYLDLTNFINGEVAPVSVVWKYLRQNYPNIELYQSDESHPSLAGSYAAACCFYASIFKKDPTLITYNGGLNSSDAAIIRSAAKTQVFDSLPLWDFKKLPNANFIYQIGTGTNQVNFTSLPMGVKQNYLWNFGDGTTSTAPSPTHSYSVNGTYTVSLTTTNCDLQGVHTDYKDTVIQFCSHTPTVYASHNWLCQYDTLWTQTADSYQWFFNGVALPETNQYVANYAQYNGSSGLYVLSTLNGCSELSSPFSQNAEWSGYYFDALGNPCEGDTVKFAVLHINGSLSGAEHILWYKNSALLSSMTNADTLLIFGSGVYECKVINPNSSTCPWDTTSYQIMYDCGDIVDVGIEERNRELFWTVFPNPASESISVKFLNQISKEQIEMYNATGSLVKTMEASETTRISIADFPNGLYFIRIKNSEQAPVKFIKQ